MRIILTAPFLSNAPTAVCSSYSIPCEVKLSHYREYLYCKTITKLNKHTFINYYNEDISNGSIHEEKIISPLKGKENHQR